MFRLPSYSGCFFCGKGNPIGVKLDIYVDGGEVKASFTLPDLYEGYKGMIHGGILSGVLDEVMWWAASWEGRRASLTVEMRVRYLKPAPTKEQYLAVARVTSPSQRIISTEGEIRRLDGGEVCVVAEGRYYLLSGERNEESLRRLDYSLCPPEVRERFLGSH